MSSSAVKKNNAEYHLLVVDDEASLCEYLEIMFSEDGYCVDTAANGDEALDKLKHSAYDLVLSDMRMPGISGMELLKQVKQLNTDTIVILMTAYSTTPQAVEAMKHGAYDYIVKPFDNEEMRLTINKALEFLSLRNENKQLRCALDQNHSYDCLVGKSTGMSQLYKMIEKVAPTSASVLVTGESGTGKELVARAIHKNSLRSDQAFIALNCGAVPENLLENELFGHEKGAFTGADSRKHGLFDQADGGTLFLDEIAELPLHMQVKLLRALQEKTIRPVGANTEHSVDVRVIAATNRDIEALMQEGLFRQDLYYRLNVVHLYIPPLRERREDIPLLVDTFCKLIDPDRDIKISAPMMRTMLDYDWPGNVRELENVVERSIILSESDILKREFLPVALLGCDADAAIQVALPEEGLDLEDYLHGIEKQMLRQALERSNGVRTKAAQLLRLSFRSLRYRLDKLGL